MKKGIKITIIICISFFVIGLTWGIINVIPPTVHIDYNPFIKKEDSLPMLVAHRGGAIANPENTLKAHKFSVNSPSVKADILETDFYLTKDNVLVLSHDPSINRMSDVELLTNSANEYLISEHTYDELLNFNMGYNFSKDGSYIYRDLASISDSHEKRKNIFIKNNISILKVEDLFNEFYTTNPNLLFIAEVKDSGERGIKATDMFYSMLQTKFPKYINNIVIGTFHPEIGDYIENNYSKYFRGASTSDAAKFIFSQLFGLNLFSNDDFACLQIPMSESSLDLTLDTYINRAHRKNIAVQYWTINDKKDMEYLISKNVDAIMTDDPESLRKVLDSHK